MIWGNVFDCDVDIWFGGWYWFFWGGLELSWWDFKIFGIWVGFDYLNWRVVIWGWVCELGWKDLVVFV